MHTAIALFHCRISIEFRIIDASFTLIYSTLYIYIIFYSILRILPLKKVVLFMNFRDDVKLGT